MAGLKERRVAMAGRGLILRHWDNDDAAALVQIFDDPEVALRTPLASPFSPADATHYLAALTEGRLNLAITTDGERPVGQIMLNLASHMVSYVVGADSRGEGIATRALALMSSYARETLGIPVVGLEIEPGNAPSTAVAKRCGFSRSDRPLEEVEDKGRRYALETWLLTS
jgi:RimJ/RimL family protein N-acetyltransferase